MSQSLHIHSVSQSDFAEKVLAASQHVPVLVDFWAAWCAPCHMLMPILAKLAEEYQGRFLLAKVNTDEQQALAGQYGVRSLPTVKVFKQGKIVDEFLGAQPESAVRAVIDRHIEKPSDRLLDDARAALEQGDTRAALAALDQAQAMDPNNLRISIERVHALIIDAAYEDAETLLKSLPIDLQGDVEIKQLYAEVIFGRIAEQAPQDSELEQRLTQNPDDLLAHYQLGAQKVLIGEYESAMEHLFTIMRKDRRFMEDAGRRGLVAVFDLLGGRNELVNRYRTKMLNALH